MSYWLLASLGFVLAVGVVGITIKLSLRHVEWPFLVLSTTIMYLALSGILALNGSLKFPSSLGSWIIWVLITGVVSAGAFLLLVTALGKADASKVVPITAGYPMVTAVLAVIFLAEPLNLVRILGIALIVFGIILVSR